MPTFAHLNSPARLTAHLQRVKIAPLPLYINIESKASVYTLMPDHFPRKYARLVSCYALFK